MSTVKQEEESESTFLRARADSDSSASRQKEVVVLWIDWYAYHVSRFQALCEHPSLAGLVAGLEMVGGTGVHKGLKFREPIPSDLPVDTIFPEGNWASISKWRIASSIWKHLDRLNPKTVLVPGYYNIPALSAALWARVKGRRSVLLTESTEGDHSRVWLRELFKKFLIRSLFDWAIAGGKPHRRYLERLGFRKDRIAHFYDVVNNSAIRNQVGVERVRHLAAERGLPNEYFLYVGRLAEEKNVGGLLEAYCAYREQGGTWSLVLVGGGPEEHQLKTAAAATSFSHDIHFPGLKSSSELIPYYAFAGCFVIASSREPWGLVVNEAMAAGLPVLVSSACGCAEDLVAHGENGYVFPFQSRGELTDCLWAISKASPREREQMSRRSLEIIDTFSPQAWAGEVARVAGL